MPSVRMVRRTLTIQMPKYSEALPAKEARAKRPAATGGASMTVIIQDPQSPRAAGCAKPLTQGNQKQPEGYFNLNVYRSNAFLRVVRHTSFTTAPSLISPLVL
ncbi:hypothetical protein KL86PLE_40948 [uncultured Pleomorphomonas sp.]|uniref:Uncharacterized protein n=1 Tax=uncultured Pleomorphomonas sp. TaxID=442121 RepID=A0A212LHV0_9HYPH|nr:hypothetical protein KL86PLE_40948 [uncultured Pleomorphomonas sp.]